MSKAEELLNSLAEAYAIETSDTRDSHIVIGADRVITVPDELKRIAVQYDHNMRTVTFDCPRYYDGRDMSEMHVYINIMSSNRARHSYIADNVRVDDADKNVMHFDWTIKRPMTDVKGSLAFLVCVRKADAEGNDVNHWNSELNTELYISEGMEYVDIIEYDYPDIVSQLLDRMAATEAIATPEAMQEYADAWLNENSETVMADIDRKAQEALDSIPADYTESYNLSNKAARTKGDAIIRTAEGEVITVADSSDDYLRGLRIFGKTEQVKTTGAQLFDASGIPSISAGGVTLTNNGDGSFTVTGEVDKLTDGINQHFDTEAIIAVLKPGMITLSADPVILTYMYVNFYDAENNVLFNLVNSTGRITHEITEEELSKIDKVRFGIYGTASGAYQTGTFKPMLYQDGDGTWEPYTGGLPSPNPDYPQDLVSVENPTAHIYGKNLLNPDLLVGGSFVKNGDGSYTFTKLENTATSATVSLNLPAGDYVFSWGEAERTCESYRVYINYVDGTQQLTGLTNLGTNKLSLSTTVGIKDIRLSLASNVTTDTYVKFAWLQFEVGTEATDYEPYRELQNVFTQHALPGIPVTSGGNYTDANGQQWICDEVDFERGVYVQRTGKVVLDGSADWVIYNYQTMHYGFNVWNLLDEKHTRSPGLCNQFVNVGSGADETIWVGVGNPNVYAISKEWYDKGLDAWKAHLNETPLEIIYARVVPIETPLTPEELEMFRHVRSNYPNTTVLNDSGVKMELKYNADTQLYIDNKIAEAVAALANKV